MGWASSCFHLSPSPVSLCRLAVCHHSERKKTQKNTGLLHEYSRFHQLPSHPVSPLLLPCHSGLPQPPTTTTTASVEKPISLPLPPPAQTHSVSINPIQQPPLLLSPSVPMPVFFFFPGNAFYFFLLLAATSRFSASIVRRHFSPLYTPPDTRFLREHTAHIKKNVTCSVTHPVEVCSPIITDYILFKDIQGNAARFLLINY